MSDVQLELRSSRVGEAVVVAASGEIDMDTAPELARAIDSGHDGAARIVIDLSGVTFLDSSTLNALVHCQRDLAEQGIAFCIVSPSDHAVRNVFDITHLTGPLSVVDSVEEALAYSV